VSIGAPAETSRRPRYLTEREIYELFHISRSTWRRMLANGHAPQPVRLGRAIRWPAKDIEAFEQHLVEDRGQGQTVRRVEER
jgi:predicted DNA-binding transcriptional regulator AlpA